MFSFLGAGWLSVVVVVVASSEIKLLKMLRLPILLVVGLVLSTLLTSGLAAKNEESEESSSTNKNKAKTNTKAANTDDNEDKEKKAVEKIELSPCDKMDPKHDGCCRNHRHCQSPVPFLHCCCRALDRDDTGCEKNKKRKKCCKCHWLGVPGSKGKRC